MFYRNLLEKLRQWATRPERKPLVLRGARQVGKTSIILEFSKEFENFLHLNLEEGESKLLFNTNASIDELLTSIFLFCNKKKRLGRTLLFIDEIQCSPEAVAKLRYFYEKASDIHVVAAGSLLESLIDNTISFPVGRVEYLAVRPCTFDEFLGAMGEDALKDSLLQMSIPDSLHNKTMSLFNTYTLIGGMPEAISHFCKHRDLLALRNVYESLIVGYMDDIEKYSNNPTMTNILRHLIKTGWNYAGQIIKFNGFGESVYRSREIGEAFRILEKTMLLELVYPTTGFGIPVLPEIKRFPKLIWLDTGLVNYNANVFKEVFGAKDIMDAWRGRIAEHITAQEILASDDRVSFKRNFWVRNKKGSESEVDFVIQSENRLIPVEVKSGHNSKLKSLHIFMDEVNHDIAVRVWSNSFSVDNIVTRSGKTVRLFNIPFYYVSSISKMIDK
jgi:hypothetical protein